MSTSTTAEPRKRDSTTLAERWSSCSVMDSKGNWTLIGWMNPAPDAVHQVRDEEHSKQLGSGVMRMDVGFYRECYINDQGYHLVHEKKIMVGGTVVSTFRKTVPSRRPPPRKGGSGKRRGPPPKRQAARKGPPPKRQAASRQAPPKRDWRSKAKQTNFTTDLKPAPHPKPKRDRRAAPPKKGRKLPPKR